MTNKRKIEEHNDNYFIKVFLRFCTIKDIIESNSWNELSDKKLDLDVENLLFQEFKLFNCVLDIEYLLCDFLEKSYKNKKIKGRIREVFIDKISKHRGIEKNVADKMLKDEIDKIFKNEKEKDKDNFFIPHIVFYISGMGLGDLIHIVREHTDDFDNKKDIIDKLTAFNDIRNDLIHNLLSSRNDFKTQILRGISLRQEIQNLLEVFLKCEYN